MKNFLITVLALGLLASAYLTRPDREEFARYLRSSDDGDKPDEAKGEAKRESKRESKDKKRETAKGGGIDRNLKEVDVREVLADDKVEFKDFYLWTVVRKDGKTLYTGVFDRWIDNKKLEDIFPS